MPRNFSTIFFATTIAVFAMQPEAGRAQLTVQQPVFGVNSVTTTVSVPDRGRAHLGSISRARDSRTHFGPFRPGTNTGLDREHTGMSVGVYIHDFEEMDRYLLGQGSTEARPSTSRLSGFSQHAMSQLQAGQGPAIANLVPVSQAASKSEKFWELGQKAEREGKLSVAQLHYRIAAKYGSESARIRLSELNRSEENSRVATASPR